jgi:hypothetical protein
MEESPRPIVVNLGSKERENEETPVSFDNTFEVDEWEDVDEYALSVLNNSEDELHKDEQKPAAIPTKNPSVTAEDDTKPAATPQDKMYKDEQKLAAIPTKNPSITAEDDTKPAATLQEEMFRTIHELPIIQQAIPSLPPFGGNVSLEFVSSVIHSGLHRRRDVVLARDGKEAKGAHRVKKTQRKKLCQRTRE